MSVTKDTILGQLSEHLLQRLEYHVGNNDIDNSDAIYSEFIVDGVDPDDGNYEWLFLERLQDA